MIDWFLTLGIPTNNLNLKKGILSFIIFGDWCINLSYIILSLRSMELSMGAVLKSFGLQVKKNLQNFSIWRGLQTNSCFVVVFNVHYFLEKTLNNESQVQTIILISHLSRSLHSKLFVTSFVFNVY